MLTFTKEIYINIKKELIEKNEYIKPYCDTNTRDRNKKFPDIIKIKNIFEKIGNDWNLSTLKYIYEMINNDILVTNYKSPSITCIYICPKYHEYHISRTGMNERLKNNNGYCGVCNENDTKNNKYLKNRSNIVINKLKEHLINTHYRFAEVCEYKNYNKKNISLICDYCKDEHTFNIPKIMKYKENQAILCESCIKLVEEESKNGFEVYDKI